MPNELKGLEPSHPTDASLLVALIAILGLAAFDLLSDLGEGTTVEHVLLEGGIILLGLLAITHVARRAARVARALRAETQRLSESLVETAAEARRWRAEARQVLDGLGVAIDRQLDRWTLTPAEKEVALLLLKGLSHREIASTRGVSEGTARQQARALYRKAGVAGRAELSAFFLEDLLLPGGASGGPEVI